MGAGAYDNERREASEGRMSNEIDEAVVQAYHNGLRDASEEWANEKQVLEQRIDEIAKQYQYWRREAKFWQGQAKQYEDWHEDALNKYHAACAELRQYTAPDAVIIELRRELANANRWIEEYRVENRRLRGE